MRERRLKQANKFMDQTNISSISKEHQCSKIQERKILAKLSVIVAPNRKGEIVVREGDESDKKLKQIINNFIVCYALKSEMAPIIKQGILNLIEQNKIKEIE